MPFQSLVGSRISAWLRSTLAYSLSIWISFLLYMCMANLPLQLARAARGLATTPKYVLTGLSTLEDNFGRPFSLELDARFCSLSFRSRLGSLQSPVGSRRNAWLRSTLAYDLSIWVHVHHRMPLRQLPISLNLWEEKCTYLLQSTL